MCDKRGFFSLRKVTEAHPNQYYFERIDTCDNALVRSFFLPNGRKHEGCASYRINHRQHPGVIRSAAVAYAVLLLKRENIGLNKIKVSEMGKYFDVLRIICHTEKKEEMESHQNR